ncbi:Rab-GTPase-TBC domain [Carpediemonas membranifera]|uniref:Rab-GTPase-TBC domain n=1 Tax=Carpediemonas membranifera TaxID=201153 RepID=A0A8J6E920_9EUKA|nr:Rab-GTPase-TBC domain [Carpediemonas membranifera]|eukprot:KAG9392695.1 Rab-GTPase-TBC domain [Carpediemonas membranifera]
MPNEQSAVNTDSCVIENTSIKTFGTEVPVSGRLSIEKLGNGLWHFIWDSYTVINSKNVDKIYDDEAEFDKDLSFSIPFSQIKRLMRRMPVNAKSFLVLTLTNPLVMYGRTVGPVYFDDGGLPELFRFLINLNAIQLLSPDMFILTQTDAAPARTPDPLASIYKDVPAKPANLPNRPKKEPYYRLVRRISPQKFTEDELKQMAIEESMDGSRVTTAFIESNLMDSRGVVAFEELRANLRHRSSAPDATAFSLEMLLGIFPKDSTAADREDIRGTDKCRYLRYKQQVLSFDPEQLKNFSTLEEHMQRVEKDAVRADRDNEFYADQPDTPEILIGGMRCHNPNILKVYHIVCAHLMLNMDLGYAQGMTDFITPVLELTDGDEARTFWIFAALMRRYGDNFGLGERNTIQRRLEEVWRLTAIVHPELAAVLRDRDCKALYFSYRWLLLLFKREMADYRSVLRLWEVVLSCRETQHFDIVMAVAHINSCLHDYVAQVTSPDEVTDEYLLQASSSWPTIDVRELAFNANMILATIHDSLNEDFLAPRKRRIGDR